MELYKEIFSGILRESQFEMNAQAILECVSYQALKKIKAIIADDSLEDCECFMKIEEVVCVFEGLGSNGGSRHDF